MARLTLEIPDDLHRKIKTLAAYVGMSMKDFLITRALAPATASKATAPSADTVNKVDDMLFSETTTFKLSPKAWDIFCEALEAPTKPNPRLEKLMQTPGLLDG